MATSMKVVLGFKKAGCVLCLTKAFLFQGPHLWMAALSVCATGVIFRKRFCAKTFKVFLIVENTSKTQHIFSSICNNVSALNYRLKNP